LNFLLRELLQLVLVGATDGGLLDAEDA